MCLFLLGSLVTVLTMSFPKSHSKSSDERAAVELVEKQLGTHNLLETIGTVRIAPETLIECPHFWPLIECHHFWPPFLAPHFWPNNQRPPQNIASR